MLPETALDKINQLYGLHKAARIAPKIATLLEHYNLLKDPDTPEFLTERDILLITYADTLRQPSVEPLKSLHQFCCHRLKDLISIIHLLPFFPYSSDDGFAVIDYRRVDPAHGGWSHIAHLREDFDLCFDLVLNHVSAASPYFKEYLTGDPQYQDFFIELDEKTDTTTVVRPRALPLLHKYSTPAGAKWCWTTFSPDQIDLNFQNPEVLLEMLDILLFYVSQGARVIRLDAIAYLWKQLGTACVHLPQTHLVVQLMRDLLDLAAPQVLLLSETNFPHADNISYFGDGYNEAQVVYNFPLPPLVLYALTTGGARHLTRWAATVKPVSERTTFLNFTASHDGIGVRPATAILTPDELQQLIKRTTAHGGQVSYKNDNQGNSIPYELNINYFDALNKPNAPAPDENMQIDRFLVSQSIALVFQGTPAIYIHSLIGSRNWSKGVAQTGQPRSINREKINLDLLEQQLLDESSRRGQVFSRYAHLITQRRREKSFHPQAGQKILDLDDALFTLARTSVDHTETIIAVHNVTDQTQTVKIESDLLKEQSDLHVPLKVALTDLISLAKINPDNSGTYHLTLKPYQFVWLKHAYPVNPAN